MNYNYDLRFDDATALNTKAKLEELNGNLQSCIERLQENLQSISENWGSEQQDFARYRKTINSNIEGYKKLLIINQKVCGFIQEYSSYIDSISAEKIG